MDVTLGPFVSALSIAAGQRDTLATAMHDQAFKTATATSGITGKEPPKTGKPKGFAIEGKVTSVAEQAGRKINVIANFLVTVDGKLSNTVIPRAAATGESTTAKDVLESITEDVMGKLFKAVKAGQVKAQG